MNIFTYHTIKNCDRTLGLVILLRGPTVSVPIKSLKCSKTRIKHKTRGDFRESSIEADDYTMQIRPSSKKLLEQEESNSPIGQAGDGRRPEMAMMGRRRLLLCHNFAASPKADR